MVLFLVYAFFFFKQKTAYEMRISDWSSDVCSSDLGRDQPAPACSPCTYLVRPAVRDWLPEGPGNGLRAWAPGFFGNERETGVSPRSTPPFSTARKTQAPYSRPLRQISTQCTNADQQSQPSGITTSSGRTTPRFLRTSSSARSGSTLRGLSSRARCSSFLRSPSR